MPLYSPTSPYRKSSGPRDILAARVNEDGNFSHPTLTVPKKNEVKLAYYPHFSNQPSQPTDGSPVSGGGCDKQDTLSMGKNANTNHDVAYSLFGPPNTGSAYCHDIYRPTAPTPDSQADYAARKKSIDEAARAKGKLERSENSAPRKHSSRRPSKGGRVDGFEADVDTDTESHGAWRDKKKKIVKQGPFSQIIVEE